MNQADCIFCKIAGKKIPSKIVFEDDEVMAFEDINPKAPLHLLVIPKRHIEKVSDIADSDAGLMGKLVLTARDLARKNGLNDSGYRIVLNCNRDAGQEVFHIHLHLLGGRKFTWPPG
ncbi:MAG: histidine triad nucleotide-binding protein [Candidatus Omnitrophica bacterium]|nr:histidine triad nucleotide-binding protein [Candidatus Omnitrophota bacterium]